MKGAVFFDYDGTLVDEKQGVFEVSDESKKTLKKLQNNGYYTILCTGRSLAYVPESFKALAMDGHITSNGAYVEVRGKEIYHDVFYQDELQRIVALFGQHHINFMLEAQRNCYVYDIDESEYKRFMACYHMPSQQMLPYELYGGEDIDKITIYTSSEEDLKKVQENIKEEYAIRKHRSANAYDFSKKYMSKAVGMKAFMKNFGIDKESTYAFGDGSNDKEMLACAGTGIAMKEHCACLEDVADMYCGSPLEEGITCACMELGLIKED